uniref:Uncharacterized protein n=1 Tax=Siphoviridae sp. ctX581 TaxID=2826365 RepID=A0A8S5MEM4_9CAUD|nr:MAG TPA: hypothetical protein [Siphoviridae sp. ctX581]
MDAPIQGDLAEVPKWYLRFNCLSRQITESVRIHNQSPESG